MKLVAVSVVKNEADVIEAFVRHTGAWVDEHLVFDHDSTDGTREILTQLVREGLPLRLFSGTDITNLQQSRSNHLTRLAFSGLKADWVLPLDADEFLVAADRSALERALSAVPPDQPASVRLQNYSPSTIDDPAEINPVKRIRHRQHGAGSTQKVFVPHYLGSREDIAAGKGSHALYQQSHALPSHALEGVALAHFALRTPHQQALRVVTAELQKLSRGKAHEGLDTHYRLGFQLLAEDADLFFSTVVQPAGRLRLDPIRYSGGELRYSTDISAFARSARALVPFLERLAKSHGELVDRSDAAEFRREESITPLDTDRPSTRLLTGAEAFTGFIAIDGWQPQEGPVPEAFLPPFHWGTAPESTFLLRTETARSVRLEAQALSYAERQCATVVLNGTELMQVDFPRVNQKENILVPLMLKPGDNHLVIRYSSWIESAADPRKLAVIFLSLRVVSN